ncbi:vWA domain-containing protein [Jiella pacifica]|uniref:VWA domain-containing protein n=1 Tax=Jiella pacifica TaxID=2696469 RepID=A0A6N9TAQ3_9HYPH|nr:vWA domain-containing protein [Jiella pacifica]NDW05978.1 VWA domain-containing protein [Jiella pacifica]
MRTASTDRRQIDPALWLLLGALGFALLAALGLATQEERRVRNLFVVVDLTRSMTARDYGKGAKVRSRLDEAKWVVTEIARKLPCGSRIGLGLFTERRSFPLIEPVEVCENFPPFADAVAALNWRMAWEGDSRVVRGLSSAQELVTRLGADLVFVTDGHEAPPLPVAGRRRAENPDRTAGVILGAGGAKLVPIPKYDESGRAIGFYSLPDIAAGARVSIATPGSTGGEYHPRNNPVGNLAATSTEHLTQVREGYLREIAAEAGLGYAPLGDLPAIEAALESHTGTNVLKAPRSLSPVFAAAALIFLIAAHGANHLFVWRRAVASPRGDRNHPRNGAFRR